MSVCLCNLSADVVLEHAARNKLELTPASPDTEQFVADPALVHKMLGDFGGRLPKPIDILVGSANRRRTAAEIASHVWKAALPPNSVLMLDEDIYVTTPEFTLLQQSSQLYQANLCQMLGRYLGTWAPTTSTTVRQVERAPLVTFESLNNFLLGVGNVRGCNNLRFAMAYTCEAAASAPETSLQLALSLPHELHGLNILQPIMNYEVELSTESKLLYPHNSIRIDLCWRHKKFGLEYQGLDHALRLGDDYARWLAARNEGYELWFVAKEQLQNAAQMSYIGHEVARRIGIDVNSHVWPTEEELQNLLDTLSGRMHPAPLSHNVIRNRLRSLRRQKA